MGFLKGLLKGIGSALGVYQDDSAQRRANKDMQAERDR